MEKIPSKSASIFLLQSGIAFRGIRVGPGDLFDLQKDMAQWKVFWGALNPLFHGRNQACKKYLALAIHKIRSLQWPMSHMYPGR
jgi:hypothetical protein